MLLLVVGCCQSVRSVFYALVLGFSSCLAPACPLRLQTWCPRLWSLTSDLMHFLSWILIFFETFSSLCLLDSPMECSSKRGLWVLSPSWPHKWLNLLSLQKPRILLNRWSHEEQWGKLTRGAHSSCKPKALSIQGQQNAPSIIIPCCIFSSPLISPNVLAPESTWERSRTGPGGFLSAICLLSFFHPNQVHVSSPPHHTGLSLEHAQGMEM